MSSKKRNYDKKLQVTKNSSWFSRCHF